MWGIIGGISIIVIIALAAAVALAWRQGFAAGVATAKQNAPSYAQGVANESIRARQAHAAELAALRTSWMRKVEEANQRGYAEGWRAATEYIQTPPNVEYGSARRAA